MKTKPPMITLPPTVDALIASLAEQNYVCDRRLGTALFLALKLQRPLFLEGEPGIGKTELAKTLALSLNTPLFRIQCYEGLDLAQAAYEWNVKRQMLSIRIAETSGRAKPEFDRADEPFDAFLLELLAENQLSIPELGVIKASAPPICIITSNRTREVHDALKRRCLYHWLNFPTLEGEIDIVRRKASNASESLYQQAVSFVQRMRKLDLVKVPGVAETIDWTNALAVLNTINLEPGVVQDTLGLLLKHHDDLQNFALDDTIAVLDELIAIGLLPAHRSGLNAKLAETN
jgi:MoxR-like ATPase